jgi:Rrf2 family protein
MRRDTRLSVALHVLLHLSELDQPITSETFGPRLKTNPVVLRRILARLREAGILRSEKGHGGGWSLARKLTSVKLGDVYDAIGVTTLFTVGLRQDRPTCLLERAVNRAVSGALAEAEELLLKHLRSISVADVLKNARGEHSSIQRGNATCMT